MRIERPGFLFLWALAGPVLAHSDASGFAGGDDHAHGEPPGAETVIEIDSPLIRSAEVSRRTLHEARPGMATVVPPADATLDINAFISGQVERLYVRPGTRVAAGDPIALLRSPEFVLTQKAYLALLANDQKLALLDGEGRLGDYLDDARENLRWWGLDSAGIDALAETGEVLEGITVQAPADGVITELLVQSGDLLNAGDRNMANFVVMGRVLARMVPDAATLFVEMQIHARDAAGVQPGDARLGVRLPDGDWWETTLQAVDPVLDAQRRMVRLLAPLPAQAGLLPGQPLVAELRLARWEQTWLPRAALSRQGLDSRVFVELEPGRYVRRAVSPGAMLGDWVAVSGLSAGTRVVTHGKLALEGAARLQRAGVGGDDHHHH